MFDEQYIEEFCQKKRAIEILVSNKHKYVYLIISKCGCSSMLSSILKDDYNKTFEPNKKIWNIINYDNLEKLNIKFSGTVNEIKTKLNFYKNQNYKIFTVIRDEIDKFISWVNECYNNYNRWFYDVDSNKIKYLTILSLNNNFVEQCIENIDKFKYDLHLVPIHVYLKIFEKLDIDIDIIDIRDLSNYYFNLTGNELTKNNITKNKILTREQLSNSQLNTIKNKLGIA